MRVCGHPGEPVVASEQPQEKERGENTAQLAPTLVHHERNHARPASFHQLPHPPLVLRPHLQLVGPHLGRLERRPAQLGLHHRTLLGQHRRQRRRVRRPGQHPNHRPAHLFHHRPLYPSRSASLDLFPKQHDHTDPGRDECGSSTVAQCGGADSRGLPSGADPKSERNLIVTPEKRRESDRNKNSNSSSPPTIFPIKTSFPPPPLLPPSILSSHPSLPISNPPPTLSPNHLNHPSTFPPSPTPPTSHPMIANKICFAASRLSLVALKQDNGGEE